MLPILSLNLFEQGHPDEHSELVALIVTIEKNDPLVLLVHQNSCSKLRLLEMAVAGNSWDLQGSFLDAVKSHIEVIS